MMKKQRRRKGHGHDHASPNKTSEKKIVPYTLFSNIFHPFIHFFCSSPVSIFMCTCMCFFSSVSVHICTRRRNPVSLHYFWQKRKLLKNLRDNYSVLFANTECSMRTNTFLYVIMLNETTSIFGHGAPTWMDTTGICITVIYWHGQFLELWTHLPHSFFRGHKGEKRKKNGGDRDSIRWCNCGHIYIFLAPHLRLLP